MESSAPFESEFELPGYDIVSEISRGAFGIVYRAIERSPARVERAVKVIDPSPFADPVQARLRFEEEVRALALLRHESVVAYHGSGYSGDQPLGRPYIIMDLIPGQTLGEASSQMSVASKVQAVLSALSGLTHAHEVGVLHRDIKPSNIVMAHDGKAVLVDFGSAFLWNAVDRHSLTTSSLGTPGYIPFEVQDNPKHRTVGHDIFALAVVLYKVVVGRLPDPANYTDVVHTNAQLLGLDRIIKMGLAREGERFKAARDFELVLREWYSTFQVVSELPNRSPGAAAFQQAWSRRESQRDAAQKAQDARERALLHRAEEFNSRISAAGIRVWSDVHAIISTTQDTALQFSDPAPTPRSDVRDKFRSIASLRRLKGDLTVSLDLVRDANAAPFLEGSLIRPGEKRIGQPPELGLPRGVPARFGNIAWVVRAHGADVLPNNVVYGILMHGIYGVRTEDIVSSSSLIGQLLRVGGSRAIVLDTPESVQEFLLWTLRNAFHLI